jgi:DNA polymerase-3 subunit epsilon
MTHHQFQSGQSGWQCKVCRWIWDKRKRSRCPGVTRYEFSTWPTYLKTAGELSRLGLQIPSAPDGSYYRRLEPHWLWLYDERKAVHFTPSVAKYTMLLLQTNEKCQMCGCEVSELDDPHIVDGLCQVCRFEKDWIEQRNEIRAWAQASLHTEGTVLLDTETTGLETTDTVIELAVISTTQGTKLLNTRIQTDQPIKQEANYRHGLRNSDLLSAPPFAEVWADLSALLKQTQTIICYNADFHRERLIWTAQHEGFAFPQVDWQCLMNRYATFYGKVRKDDPVDPFQWQALSEACKQQGTEGGQSPRSLAQVQRARRLLQALAEKKGAYHE